MAAQAAHLLNMHTGREQAAQWEAVTLFALEISDPEDSDTRLDAMKAKIESNTQERT
jgi:hypothetical protein